MNTLEAKSVKRVREPEWGWAQNGESGTHEEERHGFAEMRSNIHDPCYHELHHLSIIIIVLVFSKCAFLFERFRKEKKTKG